MLSLALPNMFNSRKMSLLGFLFLLSITLTQGNLNLSTNDTTNTDDKTLISASFFTRKSTPWVDNQVAKKLFTITGNNEEFKVLPPEFSINTYKMADLLREEEEHGGWDLFQTFWQPKQTIIVVHGYCEHDENEGIVEIRDAHLSMEDVNVVMVNWAPLASGPYPVVVNNVRRVAEWTAKLITRVVRYSDSEVEDFNMVGFSLGAHVAGKAAMMIREMTKLGIPRVTALDPARPLINNSLNYCVDKTDADFVMVIHTESEILGFKVPLGHADFYPNDGKSPQPGCEGSTSPGVCSHLMATRFYVHSVYHQRAFPASQCNSWEEYTNSSCIFHDAEYMGPFTSPSARGTYYLRTDDIILLGIPFNLTEPRAIDHSHDVDIENDILANNITPSSMTITLVVIYLVPTLVVVVVVALAFKYTRIVRTNLVI